MARRHVVSRTVKANVLEVLVCNLETKEVETITVTLPRVYPTEKETVKALQSFIPDGKKFIAITVSEVKETLYAMDEDEFIKAARILPLRGTKDSADSDTDEAETIG